MALPKQYLSNQVDLESHEQSYYGRVAVFESLMDRIRQLQNGSEEILDASLLELEKDWINSLKRLTHSKDQLNDDHFYRPIKVSHIRIHHKMMGTVIHAIF